MDDANYGSRDKRGDWKPAKLIAYPPVFIWPVRPLDLLKWLFGFSGYILPWNLLYAAIALACWRYATPSLETMRELEAAWIGFLLARNLVLALLFFGAFHFGSTCRGPKETVSNTMRSGSTPTIPPFSFEVRYSTT